MRRHDISLVSFLSCTICSLLNGEPNLAKSRSRPLIPFSLQLLFPAPSTPHLYYRLGLFTRKTRPFSHKHNSPHRVIMIISLMIQLD